MTRKSKNVELASMVKPVAITLVDKPANQVAFRVVRGENGEEVSVPVKRVRRQRTESRSAFLSISFPKGATREEVETQANEFGITNYEVTEQEDGGLLLQRTDAPTDIQDTLSVNLGEGRTLTMLRTDSHGSDKDGAQDGLQLIAIHLDKEVFRSDEEVKTFLEQKAIDIAGWGNENTDTHYVFTRNCEGPAGKSGKIELQSGVVVEVTRSDSMDVPASIAAVVSEAAYGSWGWGHLDFAAMLADVEFCNLTEQAMWRFGDLVENIMFYSQLPLAARKELLYRAAAQYALYLGNLLDGLPAGVVLVTRSSNQKKESEMTGSTQQAENPVTPTEENQQPAAESQLTRADVQAIVAEAVAAALAAETAKRADPTPAPVEEAPSVDPTQEALKVLTRSVEALTQSVSTVNDRVAELGSTTLVRSDKQDPTTSEEPQKRDVFAGVLSRNAHN